MLATKGFLYYIPSMRKKLGRPTKDLADQLTEIIPVRMTTLERANCERAANRAGVKLSAWVREKLIRAAKRESRDS